MFKLQKQLLPAVMSLLIFVFVGLLFEMSTAGPLQLQQQQQEKQPTTPGPNNFLFATELFHASCKEKLEENVIISPLSISSALGLLYFSARNETEDELRKSLRLGDSLSKQKIAENYAKLLKAASKGSAQVQIANKLYVKEGNKISKSFNDIANKYFGSEVEQVNFDDVSRTVENINKWVEIKTNNKIRNILNGIDDDTQLLIVNGIYFRGLWSNPFDLQSTQKRPFYMSPTKVVEVDTMYGDDTYKYGEIAELDVTCLELPYKDSGLSMLFILPIKKHGRVSDVREKLNKLDIRDISKNLTEKSVEVFLPRFRIEFDVGLKSVLADMGMKAMFGDKADLSGLFDSVMPIKVGDIHHKAFMDVNEAGAEAAAATIVKISLMSYNPDKAMFRADHPFIFFLKDSDTVYFAGQVISFNN